MGNKTDRRKMEAIALFITSVGVIGALVFSGLQAKILKDDFLVKTRPIGDIIFDPNDTTFVTSFLGIQIKKEDLAIGIDSREGGLYLPLEIKNFGESPLRLKSLKLLFCELDSEVATNRYFFEKESLFTEVTLLGELSFFEEREHRKLVVFQGESLKLNSNEFLADNALWSDLQRSVNNKKQDLTFVENISQKIKSGRFVFFVKMSYSFFDESLQNNLYQTYKGWLVSPDNKSACLFYRETK